MSLSLAPTTLTQSGSPVYPRGAVLLWRNATRPIRAAGPPGSQFRAHVNFSGEEIEFALLVLGSDGQTYCNHRTRFPLSDGWVVGAVSGSAAIPLVSNIRTITAIRWQRANTQVDLDIDWFFVRTNDPTSGWGPSRVDRETTLTQRKSPDIPHNYSGGYLTRYFITDVEKEPTGGWSKTRTLPSGGILAPIVRISWRERLNNGSAVAQELWVPGSSVVAPLPGLNDCLQIIRGRCEDSNNVPLGTLRYNQSYVGRVASFSNSGWIYRRSLGGWLYVEPRQGSILLDGVPVQYPVYVFKDIGRETGTSSSIALVNHFPTYHIPYDTPAWWRVHIASIYENVPYEWGGKYYAAEASGRILNDADSTNKGFGLDCSGLIAVARERANDSLYGTGAIERETYELVHVTRDQRGNTVPQRDSRGNKRYKWEEVRPGDVLLRTERGKEHVMLVVKNQYISQVHGRPGFYTITFIEAYGVTPSSMPGGNPTVVEKVRYRTETAHSLLGAEGRDEDDFVPRRFRGE